MVDCHAKNFELNILKHLLFALRFFTLPRRGCSENKLLYVIHRSNRRELDQDFKLKSQLLSNKPEVTSIVF